MISVCRCGHDRDAHEHWRRGQDCALCDCPRWRLPFDRTAVALAVFGTLAGLGLLLVVYLLADPR